MNERCENCRFWDNPREPWDKTHRTYGETRANCRRYPPKFTCIEPDYDKEDFEPHEDPYY
jgi:hypothetical protein